MNFEPRLQILFGFNRSTNFVFKKKKDFTKHFLVIKRHFSSNFLFRRGKKNSLKSPLDSF